MARNTDITVFRGEDLSLSFTAYTNDTGSTPENISGWTIVFTVADDNNPSATKRIQVTCTITVAANGTHAAAITAAQLNLEPGTYYWDSTRTDSGSVRVLGYGKFIVLGVPRLPAA